MDAEKNMRMVVDNRKENEGLDGGGRDKKVNNKRVIWSFMSRSL